MAGVKAEDSPDSEIWLVDDSDRLCVSIHVILMDKFDANLKCIARKAIGRDAAALSCGYCGADTDPVGASKELQKSACRSPEHNDCATDFLSIICFQDFQPSDMLCSRECTSVHSRGMTKVRSVNG
jgi:hypothetical protein